MISVLNKCCETMTTKSPSSVNAKLSSKSTEVTIPVCKCTVCPSLHDLHVHDTVGTSIQVLVLLLSSTPWSSRPFACVILLKPIAVPSVAKSTRIFLRDGSSGYKFTYRRFVTECVSHARFF